MIRNHEIDYKIYGEELQFVEIELDPNETAIAESGAFMMMESRSNLVDLWANCLVPESVYW
jgi:uncharacterized protein (AIM24 family)